MPCTVHGTLEQRPGTLGAVDIHGASCAFFPVVIDVIMRRQIIAVDSGAGSNPWVMHGGLSYRLVYPTFQGFPQVEAHALRIRRPPC